MDHPPSIPFAVASLLNKIREYYLFIGVDENDIIVKYFRSRVVITGKLITLPSPRVSINFKDVDHLKVNARHANIRFLFT